MQNVANKGKAVKIALVILIVLVVLAGALGVTMYFVKNGKDTGDTSKDLSVTYSVYEKDKTSSSSYGLIIVADTVAQMKKTIEKDGYCDIAIEFLKSDVEGELVWQLRDGQNIINPSPSTTITVVVDEKDSKKAVLRIRKLNESAIQPAVAIEILVSPKDDSSAYSVINVMSMSIDYTLV